MRWTQARPLRTTQGAALATEIADSPTHAYALVSAALYRLSRWEEPPAALPPQEAEVLLDDYLRGIAATAVVADTAHGTRLFTGPEDFAVKGRPAALLSATELSIGLLMQAAAAGFISKWATEHLVQFVPGPVLEEHRTCVRQLRESLSGAAQRMLKE